MRLLVAFFLLVPAVGFANCLTAADLAALKACHPLRIVVGSAPGGTQDIFARELEGVMRSGQQNLFIIVDNRPGAGGQIAAADVAFKKDPCSFMLAGTAALSTNFYNPALKPQVNPLKDFEPVALIAKNPMILIVNTEKTHIKNLQDFLKQFQKGDLSYSTSGVGSANHLAVVKLEQALGVKIPNIHAPARGATDSANLLRSSSIDFVMDNPYTGVPLLTDPKMRALAVSSDSEAIIDEKKVPPLSSLPQLKGFHADAWYGLVGSTKLSPKLKAAMSAATKCMLNDPVAKAKYTAQGYIFQDGTPDSLTKFITSELAETESVCRIAIKNSEASDSHPERTAKKTSH